MTILSVLQTLVEGEWQMLRDFSKIASNTSVYVTISSVLQTLVEGEWQMVREFSKIAPFIET